MKRQVTRVLRSLNATRKLTPLSSFSFGGRRWFMERDKPKKTPEHVLRPHTAGEYIRNVLEQSPTEFGSQHPLGIVRQSSMRPHEPATKIDSDSGGKAKLRTHKPVTKSDETPPRPVGKDGKPITMDYLLYRPIWSEEDVQSIKVAHRRPNGISDFIAYWSLTSLKELLNLACGYTTSKIGLNKFNEKGWLYRITFLETVAGIPGFVGAMARHCKSLREMRRDQGWIHTLLEEAENERMHLLVCLDYLKPNKPFRALVFGAQFVMFTMWGITYFCSPRIMHRLVGYLEDEAVSTYLELLKLIDDGHLPGFQQPAKDLGRLYWQLPEGATMRDVFAQICADEANHRLVNHTFADLTIKQYETGQMQPNPFQKH